MKTVINAHHTATGIEFTTVSQSQTCGCSHDRSTVNGQHTYRNVVRCANHQEA